MHRACMGLHQVIYIYVVAVSLELFYFCCLVQPLCKGFCLVLLYFGFFFCLVFFLAWRPALFGSLGTGVDPVKKEVREN